MKRRNALKLLGAVAVAFAGKIVAAEDEVLTNETLAKYASETSGFWADVTAMATNFQLDEETINDIIINRKNGKKITIPFSEICDALEGSE